MHTAEASFNIRFSKLLTFFSWVHILLSWHEKSFSSKSKWFVRSRTHTGTRSGLRAAPSVPRWALQSRLSRTAIPELHSSEACS